MGESTLYHYGNTTLGNNHYDYIHLAKPVESQYSFSLADDIIIIYANFDIQSVHTLANVEDIGGLYPIGISLWYSLILRM